MGIIDQRNRKANGEQDAAGNARSQVMRRITAPRRGVH